MSISMTRDERMYLTGHSGSAEEIAAAKTQVKYAVDYLSLIDGGIAAFRAGKPESIRHTFNIFSDSTICMDHYFPMRAALLAENSKTPVEDLKSLAQEMSPINRQFFFNKVKWQVIHSRYQNPLMGDMELDKKVLQAALEAGATPKLLAGESLIHRDLKAVIDNFTRK